MKPYQTAWEVAEYMLKYRNKYKRPINKDAITEYFKGGLIRELEKINGSSNKDLEICEEALTWAKELEKWLRCWYSWIYEIYDY